MPVLDRLTLRAGDFLPLAPATSLSCRMRFHDEYLRRDVAIQRLIEQCRFYFINERFPRVDNGRL